MRSGSPQLVIRASRVVLPDGIRAAAVTVADGKISDVGPYDLAAGARAGPGGAVTAACCCSLSSFA